MKRIAFRFGIAGVLLLGALTGSIVIRSGVAGIGQSPPPAGGGGGDLLAANNLSDLASTAMSRMNLGLGTASTVDHGVMNGNVPLMDTTGYPAADGSQITGISAGSTAYMQADKSGDTAITFNNAVTAWTENVDAGSNFNPTTGIYTVPSDGVYYVQATLAQTGTTGFRAQVLHTAGTSTLFYAGSGASGSTRASSVGTLLNCSTGDTIAVSPQGGSITVDAIVGSNVLSHLSIIKL